MTLTVILVAWGLALFYGMCYVAAYLALKPDVGVFFPKWDKISLRIFTAFWPVTIPMWALWQIRLKLSKAKPEEYQLPAAKSIPHRKRNAFRWGSQGAEYWRGVKKHDGGYKYFRR